MAGNGRVVGLDYAGARAGLAAERLRLSPEGWRDLRAIEAGALERMNEEKRR